MAAGQVVTSAEKSDCSEKAHRVRGVGQIQNREAKRAEKQH